MPNHATLTLLSRLTDVESLEYLARRGIELEIIPDDVGRLVTAWALDYLRDSGYTQAPSREALLETWGQKLEDFEIELEPEDVELDTMDWAIKELRDQWLYYQAQTFTKKMASDIAEADGPDRMEVFREHTAKLQGIALSMEDHTDSSDLAQGFEDAWNAYLERETSGHLQQGLTFALGPVDDHTFGIHPGELAVLAAPAKGGKSFFIDRAAFQEALTGRTVVLFTLENSVEMTWNRIICMATNIDSKAWHQGKATEEEKRRFRELCESLKERGVKLRIIKPDKPTVASMVQQAHLLGADSLYIDQLTHVEPAERGRKAQHEIVRDIMRELKRAISSGPKKLPCLLAHQINREGIKAAEKEGGLEMYHLAESAEVERTADWVFGLYQTETDRLAAKASLSILAARRVEPKSWTITWRPATGFVTVLGQWNK